MMVSNNCKTNLKKKKGNGNTCENYTEAYKI
jgi:hypothetical protein